MAKLIDITDSEQAEAIVREASRKELALEFAESIHAGFPSPAADHAGERFNLAPQSSQGAAAKSTTHSTNERRPLNGGAFVIIRLLKTVKKDEFGTVFAANLREEYKTKTPIQKHKDTNKNLNIQHKNIYNNASRYS